MNRVTVLLRPISLTLCVSIFQILTPIPAHADSPCARSKVLVKQIEEIRGLKSHTEPNCKELTREEFQKVAEKIVKDDLMKMSLEKQRLILEFLGFIPQSYPFERCIISEYARRAMAFYSPTMRTLFLPNWYEIPDAIIAHELVHALQDQNFKTLSMGNFPFLFDDRNIAASMVLEGDAMRNERLWRKKNGKLDEEDLSSHQLESSSPDCMIPDGLADLSSAGYAYGEHMANTLAETGRSINSFFQSYPSSTSQLLYRSPETRISKAGIVIGELAIRLMLSNGASNKTAVFAARGWQSDAVSFENNRLIWRTQWKSIADAEEFYQAYVNRWNARLHMQLNSKSRLIRVSHPTCLLDLEWRDRQVISSYSRTQHAP